ncbi:hypothetical protein PYR77_08400 [Acinetobacter soli]|nr:hypothetical protein [Acinetobacter soli]WEH99489.1 hypothetical protein PYR77_08400 [Acinetobacter soli]
MRVDPQQIQVFELEENDEIELFLPHEQSIEMITRDANQQHQDHLLQALDHSDHLYSAPSVHTYSQLKQQDHSAYLLQQQLAQFNIATENLNHVIHITTISSIRFRATATAQVIVFNTGRNMQIDEQTPIDEIKVIIHKNKNQTEYLPLLLPNRFRRFVSHVHLHRLIMSRLDNGFKLLMFQVNSVQTFWLSMLRHYHRIRKLDLMQ